MKKSTRQVVFGLAAAGLCTAVALGALIRISENFENIQPHEDPQRGWTFNSGNESVAQRNGNHYLRTSIDTWGVTLSTKSNGSNRLVGNRDYRREGVAGFEITTAGTADFNTVRDMSISLVNDNGTPNDWSDDYGFYHVTGQMMRFDGSPRTYRYRVPSRHAGSTPDGWVAWSIGPNSPTEFSWDDVITDVDQVNFHYFHPENFYIFQFHHVGVDNIRVVINTDWR